jgi:PTH1 family peptidyl-tRNA hydrolase
MDRLAETAGVGFRVQSRLLAETARTRLDGQDVIFAKPTTYMNHSGQAVRAVMDYYRQGVEETLVAYDELDLPPGVARLKQGGGHGGHNGLRDIFRHAASPDFLRLRIGIGHPGNRDAVTAYVLSRASAEQERLIRNSVSDAIEVLPQVLGGDIAGAMKTLHTVKEDGI